MTALSVSDSPPPPKQSSTTASVWPQRLLIGAVLLFWVVVIFIPALNVVVQAFAGGGQKFFESFHERTFLQSAQLTLLMAVIAVPINTIFGLAAAKAIARKRFPGRALLLSLLDIPFSISPVVAGLMLVLLYGRNGWFGPLLDENGIRIIFAVPGMVLATLFVTLPFVAREVIPSLEEFGSDQEEAAKTLGASDWQIFWRVTLPGIRWSLLYGVVLTNARAMGEFGAVSVVSGSIAGKTQTLPLYVEEAYKQYQTEAAYAAAVVLGALAIITLVVKTWLERETKTEEEA